MNKQDSELIEILRKYQVDASKELLIDTKDIEIVLLHNLFLSTDGYVCGQKNLDETGLPCGSEFITGYYADEKQQIILSRHVYLKEDGQPRASWVALTQADILASLLHELRHVWQYTYDHDTFYMYNARREELIHDAAEIDADAFSIAYLLSSKTPYTHEDAPLWFSSQQYINKFNKKRWKYAITMNEQYGFNDVEKIIMAKRSL